MTAPNLRTSQGEDAIVDYIRGFNFALHTQVDLMRRFLRLHPKPPPDLDHWDRRGVPEFAEQIDDFAASICEALGIYNVDMFDTDSVEVETFNRNVAPPCFLDLPKAEEDFMIGPRLSMTKERGLSLKEEDLNNAKGLCLIDSKDTNASRSVGIMSNDGSNGHQGSDQPSDPFEAVKSMDLTEYSLSPPSSPMKPRSEAWTDSQDFTESEVGSVIEPRLAVEPEPVAAKLPESGVFACQQYVADETPCLSSLPVPSASLLASVAARQRFLKSPEDECQLDGQENNLQDENDATNSALCVQTAQTHRPRFNSFDTAPRSSRQRTATEDTEENRATVRRLSVSSSDSRASGVSASPRHSRGSRRRSMRHGSAGSMFWKQDMDETLEEIRTMWDSEGETPEKGRRCPSGVLNPQWIGRLGWDIAVISLVLIDAMVLPFQMAYKDSDNPDDFDAFWLWLTTNFFACDIVINFFTAYEAGARETDMEPGTLVTRKSRIAYNYLRSWFPIDFVSTIPWSQVTKLFSGGGDSGGSSSAAQAAKLTKALKFIRFLRLMRMLRLAKLAAIWERVEQRMGSLVLSQAVALLRVMFMLVSICHWNACLWWIIGKPENLFTDLLSEEAKASFQSIPHWTTLPRKYTPQDPEVWIWLDKSIEDAYIFCFYWTLGVMRTMPAEVTPVNKPERVYLMIFMFFAFSAFAISISQITQAFFKFSERKRVFNEDMSALRMHLRSIKAPNSLQVRVKSFSTYLFERRRLLAKENNLLQNLPIHLYERLKAARLAPHLQKLEVFRALKGEALQLVSELLADVRDMLPGDFISVRGRPADAAWVKISGRLSQVLVDGVGLQPATLSEWDSDVVDEACLTLLGYSAGDTVMVTLCSEVLRIDKKKFASVRKKHPNFERLLRRANTIQGQDGRQSSMTMSQMGSSLQNKPPQRVNEAEENRLQDIGAIVSA